MLFWRSRIIERQLLNRPIQTLATGLENKPRLYDAYLDGHGESWPGIMVREAFDVSFGIPDSRGVAFIDPPGRSFEAELSETCIPGRPPRICFIDGRCHDRHAIFQPSRKSYLDAWHGIVARERFGEWEGSSVSRIWSHGCRDFGRHFGVRALICRTVTIVIFYPAARL